MLFLDFHLKWDMFYIRHFLRRAIWEKQDRTGGQAFGYHVCGMPY
jgi:hypothetical protein